ncbi:MAG: hypothetical protein R3C19_00550 [Planctomycetaceae bacterium]
MSADGGRLAGVRRAVLRAVGGGLAVLAISGSGFASDALLTQSTSFRIPFTVDAARGTPVAGHAILFSSVDGGPLEQAQRVPATAQGFQFTAPRDGRYAFAVRMTDAAGNLAAAAGPLVPELEVIVDSTAPNLQLELFEAGPGKALVRWNCSETQISPGSLRIEYAEGNDGRWLPLHVNSATAGQSEIASQPGTVVSVRGSVTDLAGNRGEGSNQLVLSHSGAGMHSPSAGSGVQPMTGPLPVGGAPLNLNPWGQSSETNLPVGIGSGHAAAPDAMHEVNSVSVPQIVPTKPARVRPVSQPTSAIPSSAELVNSQTFEIAYEVDDVGPSGVGRVELFVTEDNGQKWFRYGEDADRQSPFQVDVMGEGTFGFAIRVRNGLGFGDPPPQPGEAPDVLIAVDQTVPVIDFDQPQVLADNHGSVHLNWRVADQSGLVEAVRLEVSSMVGGPWTPVFDWQQNPGHFEWPIQPGTPPSVHFRVLARDAAGNVASAQTSQAVLIDQKRPTARVLRVQPTSGNGVSF